MATTSKPRSASASASNDTTEYWVEPVNGPRLPKTLPVAIKERRAAVNKAFSAYRAPARPKK